ncbi:MAG: hypothetical protein NZM43_09385 [Saprospiraceae bacterium]|nr:hypothetical protein [Saprospiraceae bacterium]MDW8484527.1 hypothetical protein [Saprospiraceae bacterium]
MKSLKPVGQRYPLLASRILNFPIIDDTKVQQRLTAIKNKKIDLFSEIKSDE